MLLRRRYLSFKNVIQKREDMEIIEVKDYIASPKQNGYKSLHMIIKYPLSLNSGTKKSLQKFSYVRSQWTFGQA